MQTRTRNRLISAGCWLMVVGLLLTPWTHYGWIGAVAGMVAVIGTMGAPYPRHREEDDPHA